MDENHMMFHAKRGRAQLLLQQAAPVLESTTPDANELEEARAKAEEATVLLAEMIDLLTGAV